MITALVNGRVLTADGFVEGKSVVVEGGRIAAVVDGVPAADDLRDLGGGVLLPGFIDTQVNGGGGVLFNDDPSVEAVAAIGRAHRRFGTTGFLPTLISDDQAVIARAIAAADEAIAAGVPIVPICVSTTSGNINLNRWNNGHVIVEMLAPVDTSKYGKENVRELAAHCRELMEAKIAQLDAEVAQRNAAKK